MSESKGKIKEWLEGEGVFKEEVEDENAEFHYAGEYPPRSGQHIEVIKPPGGDKLLIGSRISLGKDHLNALHNLPQKQKDDLLWQVRFDLLFRGPEFRMVPSARDLEAMEFTKTLYEEELSKPKFMEELQEIFRCKLYLIWRLSQMSRGIEESEGLYQ